jgi:hypothetical protein
MSERKAVIKNADMSDEMQTDAIDCAANVRDVWHDRCPGLLAHTEQDTEHTTQRRRLIDQIDLM